MVNKTVTEFPSAGLGDTVKPVFTGAGFLNTKLNLFVAEEAALASKRAYQAALSAAGRGQITTEIIDVPVFYFAEDYHQQYLAKNPNGYCGIGGTGVSCPLPQVKVG